MIAASLVELGLGEPKGGAQIGAREVGFLKVHACDVGLREGCAGEVGAARICLREASAFKAGLWAGGVDQTHAREIRLREVGAVELGVRSVGAREHCVGEIAAAEVRMCHPRPGEDSSGEVAVFANAGIRGCEIKARIGAERPKRVSVLARRNYSESSGRENGQAQLCQHGAGIVAAKMSRQ